MTLVRLDPLKRSPSTQPRDARRSSGSCSTARTTSRAHPSSRPEGSAAPPSSSGRSRAGARPPRRRRVAELRLPEARRDVDDRLEAGAGDDLAEPRLHPEREPRHREAAVVLHVEHGQELALERCRDREEVVGLGDRARHDRRIGGAGRATHVVRAEAHPQHRRARAVERERQVGERRRLRRLGEDEASSRCRRPRPSRSAAASSRRRSPRGLSGPAPSFPVASTATETRSSTEERCTETVSLARDDVGHGPIQASERVFGRC